MGQSQGKPKPEPLVYGPASQTLHPAPAAKSTKSHKARTGNSRHLVPDALGRDPPATKSRSRPSRESHNPRCSSYPHLVPVPSKASLRPPSQDKEVRFKESLRQYSPPRWMRESVSSDRHDDSAGAGAPHLAQHAELKPAASADDLQRPRKEPQQQQQKHSRSASDRRSKRYAGNWDHLRPSKESLRPDGAPMSDLLQTDAEACAQKPSLGSDDAHRGTVGEVTRYVQKIHSADVSKELPPPPPPAPAQKKTSKADKRSSTRAILSEAICDNGLSALLSDSTDTTNTPRPMKKIRGFELPDSATFRPLPDALTTPTGTVLPSSETAYFSALSTPAPSTPPQRQPASPPTTPGATEIDDGILSEPTAAQNCDSHKPHLESAGDSGSSLKSTQNASPTLAPESLGMRHHFLDSFSSSHDDLSSIVNSLPQEWLWRSVSLSSLEEKAHQSERPNASVATLADVSLHAPRAQPHSLHVELASQSLGASEQASVYQQDSPQAGSSAETLLPTYREPSPMQRPPDWHDTGQFASSQSARDALSQTADGRADVLDVVASSLFEHNGFGTCASAPSGHPSADRSLNFSHLQTSDVTDEGLQIAQAEEEPIPAVEASEIRAEGPQTYSQFLSKLPPQWTKEPKSRFSSTTSAGPQEEEEEGDTSFTSSQASTSSCHTHGGSSADCSADCSDNGGISPAPRVPYGRRTSVARHHRKTLSSQLARPQAHRATRLPPLRSSSASASSKKRIAKGKSCEDKSSASSVKGRKPTSRVSSATDRDRPGGPSKTTQASGSKGRKGRRDR